MWRIGESVAAMASINETAWRKYQYQPRKRMKISKKNGYQYQSKASIV
jgi:hypothetical protein